MPEPLMRPLTGRYWRMLRVRWQRTPLDSGSHLFGGRFNRQGQTALYLSADHATAIAEFHQIEPRPGTLIGYDIVAAAIADLTDPRHIADHGIDPGTLSSPWADLVSRRLVPPSWPIVDRLIAGGAQGALYPSMQRRGGINLVLWHWHAAVVPGEGAAVTVIDPMGDLGR